MQSFGSRSHKGAFSPRPRRAGGTGDGLDLGSEMSLPNSAGAFLLVWTCQILDGDETLYSQINHRQSIGTSERRMARGPIASPKLPSACIRTRPNADFLGTFLFFWFRVYPGHPTCRTSVIVLDGMLNMHRYCQAPAVHSLVRGFKLIGLPQCPDTHTHPRTRANRLAGTAATLYSFSVPREMEEKAQLPVAWAAMLQGFGDTLRRRYSSYESAPTAAPMAPCLCVHDAPKGLICLHTCQGFEAQHSQISPLANLRVSCFFYGHSQVARRTRAVHMGATTRGQRGAHAVSGGAVTAPVAKCKGTLV